jgi:general stress protein 26
VDRTTAIDEAKRLVERSRFVMIGSIGEQGYPNIKAMFRLEHEGLTRFLVSTNTSSKHAGMPVSCGFRRFSGTYADR